MKYVVPNKSDDNNSDYLWLSLSIAAVSPSTYKSHIPVPSQHQTLPLSLSKCSYHLPIDPLKDMIIYSNLYIQKLERYIYFANSF